MLDEPSIYLWYESGITIISTPLNIFTFYCILRKTPPEMREYRPHLVLYQIFILLCDLVLESIRPELNFPCLSGRIFGIWDSIFNLGAGNALASGSFFVGSFSSAVNVMFFYKWQSLLAEQHFFKLPTFGRILYMIILYLFPIFLAIGFRLLPIQKGAESEFLTELVEKNPQFAYLQNYPDIYASKLVPIYPPYINFPVINFLLLWIVLYGVIWMSTMNVIYTILCNKLINDLFHGHLSKKTRLQQKKLLTALSIQTAIPLISSGLPWFYYGIILGIGQTEIKQTLNNIAFAFLGSHGTQSSLALLVLTEPYRIFLLRCLQKVPILKRLATFYLTKRGHIFVASSTSNNTRTGVQT